MDQTLKEEDGKHRKDGMKNHRDKRKFKEEEKRVKNDFWVKEWLWKQTDKQKRAFLFDFSGTEYNF